MSSTMIRPVEWQKSVDISVTKLYFHLQDKIGVNK